MNGTAADPPRSARAEGSLGDLDASDEPLDLAASAALIDAQRARVVAAIDVDARVLFGIWGTAWLLGFGLLWAVALEEPLVDLSIGTALVIFTTLLVSAVVVTTVHVTRRSSGLQGGSAAQGAMYGWAWFLAFACIGVLGAALDRLDADGPIVSTVMTISSALLAGALYMAGGALWRDRTQFALGAWICIATIAAGLVGYPYLLLVMSLAGGGGMLVGAVIETVRRRRRAR